MHLYQLHLRKPSEEEPNESLVPLAEFQSDQPLLFETEGGEANSSIELKVYGAGDELTFRLPGVAEVHVSHARISD